MQMKRKSLKLDEIDWQVLLGIAADCGCEYRGKPSWRRLVHEIASGKLSVVNRPNQRLRDFQDEAAKADAWRNSKNKRWRNWTARSERDRLRQERKPPCRWHSAAWRTRRTGESNGIPR